MEGVPWQGTAVVPPVSYHTIIPDIHLLSLFSSSNNVSSKTPDSIRNHLLFLTLLCNVLLWLFCQSALACDMIQGGRAQGLMQLFTYGNTEYSRELMEQFATFQS